MHSVFSRGQQTADSLLALVAAMACGATRLLTGDPGILFQGYGVSNMGCKNCPIVPESCYDNFFSHSGGSQLFLGAAGDCKNDVTGGS